MAKQEQSPLFQLIQGMNKMEKRHFKLYARYNSQNAGEINYLRLFDAIAKQDEYDEEKIAALGLVKKEHLRMLKNYLYNLILESMRLLRWKGDDIDCSIKSLLDNALIMREKGITKEEFKFLERAKQLSYEHERWGPALQTLLLQSEKMTRDGNFKLLEEIEKEIPVLIGKLENLFECKKMRRESLLLLRSLDLQKAIRNKKQVQKILDTPLVRDAGKGLTAAAKKESYFTRAMCQTAIGDYTGTIKTLEVVEKFIEANYGTLDYPEIHHASVLSNMAGRQMELGRFKDAFVTIQKHRSIVTKSTTVRDYIFVFSRINETNYYLTTGEFEKGVAAIKEMEGKINKFKTVINQTSIYVLYFNIASIYFIAGDFLKALQWIRRVTNAAEGAAGEDIKAWAHIVMILIHYELRTEDIIEHLTDSALRFMNKRARLYKVEGAVLDFMRKLNKTVVGKKDVKEEFSSFIVKLTEILKDPKEQKALMYFDLISWLESKIEGRPLAEIVKSKALKEK